MRFLLGLLVGLWVGIIVYEVHTYTPEPTHETESGIELWQLAQAEPLHTENVCRFRYTEMFDEEVFISYPEKTDTTSGRWNYPENVIELMQPDGLNVEVVAHEVSHMVDSFMEKYEVQDPHFEAYMQGYWTECVYEIMLEDIRIAKEGKFRFAD